MILSVATSVVFLFLTRKGHLLPPAAQGGPLDKSENRDLANFLFLYTHDFQSSSYVYLISMKVPFIQRTS